MTTVNQEVKVGDEVRVGMELMIVVPCIDKDQTVCKTLTRLKKTIPNCDELFFCNGGDRTGGKDTPEHKLCEEVGIKTVYGLGEKIQSSSWLTEDES